MTIPTIRQAAAGTGPARHGKPKSDLQSALVANGVNERENAHRPADENIHELDSENTSCVASMPARTFVSLAW